MMFKTELANDVYKKLSADLNTAMLNTAKDKSKGELHPMDLFDRVFRITDLAASIEVRLLMKVKK